MSQPLTFEVREYKKRIVIGCDPSEQSGPAQEVVFDIVAEFSCSPRYLVETWHPELDYCDLTDAVDEACARAGVKILQEPLALDVVGRIFAKSPAFTQVEVLIQKTERYQHTRSIGFRIRLSRAEYAALQEAMHLHLHLQAHPDAGPAA
ncbi:MAG: hypothetical protein ORN28_05110 [Rhodoferax sp.]|nr:hypothetical protein [Rhodoferax sp.]